MRNTIYAMYKNKSSLLYALKSLKKTGIRNTEINLITEEVSFGRSVEILERNPNMREEWVVGVGLGAAIGAVVSGLVLIFTNILIQEPQLGSEIFSFIVVMAIGSLIGAIVGAALGYQAADPIKELEAGVYKGDKVVLQVNPPAKLTYKVSSLIQKSSPDRMKILST